MSLESGCRQRLEQSEDGRRAVALLDAWENQINDHCAEIARLRQELEDQQKCSEVYREHAEHFMRAMKFHSDLAKPVLKLLRDMDWNAEVHGTGGPTVYQLDVLGRAVLAWLEAEAAADQFG